MNQRYTGPVLTYGTNMTRPESDKLDALIARADLVLKTINYRRAAAALRMRKDDAENGLLK